MPGNTVLNPDFIEFFQLLNANGVSYLIMGAPGVDFEECYPRKIIEEVDGVSLAFIDLENLKKNKRASGRLQDLADIENLGSILE